MCAVTNKRQMSGAREEEENFIVTQHNEQVKLHRNSFSAVPPCSTKPTCWACLRTAGVVCRVAASMSLSRAVGVLLSTMVAPVAATPPILPPLASTFEYYP
jgi:hypothetical protein